MTVEQDCGKCLGERLVANTDDQEPWSMWAGLPPGSDLAVQLGMVRPVPCPTCRPAEYAAATGGAAPVAVQRPAIHELVSQLAPLIGDGAAVEAGGWRVQVQRISEEG